MLKSRWPGSAPVGIASVVIACNGGGFGWLAGGVLAGVVRAA